MLVAQPPRLRPVLEPLGRRSAHSRFPARSAPGACCSQLLDRAAADFYDVFDGIARALKAYDPTLLVGGPLM